MLCRAPRPLQAPCPPGKAPLVAEPFLPAISRGLCAAGLPTSKVEPGSSAGEIESGLKEQKEGAEGAEAKERLGGELGVPHSTMASPDQVSPWATSGCCRGWGGREDAGGHGVERLTRRGRTSASAGRPGWETEGLGRGQEGSWAGGKEAGEGDAGGGGKCCAPAGSRVFHCVPPRTCFGGWRLGLGAGGCVWGLEAVFPAPRGVPLHTSLGAWPEGSGKHHAPPSSSCGL